VRCSASATPAEAGAGLPDACRLDGAVQKAQIAGTVKAQGAVRPDDVAKYLNGELRKRICVVGGDTAAKIDADTYKECFTSGADICGTNTYNCNAISLKASKTQGAAYDLNKKAAQLAKRAAADVTTQDAERPRFVAGVVGEADCLLSSASGVTWDDMVEAYGDQIHGLVDGGADILHIIFADTLNAKAAVYAADEYFEQSRKERLPIMLTAVIDDESGRTLSGQTIEAALVSLQHAKPMSVGISCSPGSAQAKTVCGAMSGSSLSWCHMSAKAGGKSPDAQMLECATGKKINLVVVQPAHVSAVSSKLKGSAPRLLPEPPRNPAMQLSSLQAHTVEADAGLQVVSQRCNVAGSQRFRGLVDAYKWTTRENKWEAAIEFCGKQDADMLDFNFDSDTIDAKWAMGKFMHLCAAEPKVAKVPFILSSMKWPVIEEGLKCTQGKCIVNAISLLQGEEEFVRIAKGCQRYGAAIIVMAIEREGEYATYRDKVRICQRSYELLRSQLNFPAQDIIFDCNVAPVGEGSTAKDFIDAVGELKRTCPSVSFIGGVSNLSLPYRNVNMIREALHSAFLYNAIPKGLNLAIVQPGALPRYTDLEAPTKSLCENIVLAEPWGDEFRKLTEFVGFLDGPAVEDAPGAVAVVEQMLPLAMPEPPRVNPMFRKPLTDIVQATGTINASIFQSFGSKSHASKSFHRLQMATIVKRNVMFSSISVWMGQGGSGPTTGSSSFMDGLALWERQQQMMNMSATVLWGAIGEIGLRLAIYGSRDVFAQFDLGQKLIGPADTQFLEKQIAVGSDVQEFIACAYLDQTWQATMGGRGGGGLEGRKTFADM